ncbi:Lacal_2735 family protein [Hyunsoonleella sp. SJ7]|uniref:Lacal_2735 family protein n=1 Tax=Hyunsoonleella aquatilis TaxID=2762758 RepID=A0A923HI46_9FLAO|nr:Lacal_2735 family protein [Hyunsoonleella aquatilis]MBC3758792.1 Lacal_2735 family protein [Hyunsoonleella aquatilis]
MNRIEAIKSHQIKLNKKYKKLMERAYNFRQTDAPLSDFAEYEAIKLLDKINKLNYLYREQHQQAS